MEGSSTSTVTTNPPKHRKKREHDPFFELTVDSSHSPTDSGSGDAHGQEGVQTHESFITKLIITPILFISFLFSLFLVNRRNRSWRISQRASRPSSFWAHLNPLAWLDPEPYQDLVQTDGSAGEERKTGPHEARLWFAKKKHRKIAQLEIGDAFELRKRVMVGMAVVGMLAFLGVFWVLEKAYKLVVG